MLDTLAGKAAPPRHRAVAIQAQDPHADPAELAWMAADGVRSLLMIPLVVGDQAIGLLELMEKHQERIFTPAEIDLGQTLANHAAAALENARLYAETLRHSRELTLLNRVIAASAASLDLESILAVVCRELSLAFGAPHVAAALLDESRTQVFIAGEHIAGTMPSILGETVSLGSTLPNSLLFNQKPAVVTDARRESRLAPFCNRMQGAGVVAVLILPLAIEGEVKGLLGLSFTEPRIWSAEEMGLAGRVAEQVSGVLARARLEGTQRQLSAAVEQSAEAVVVADTTGYLIYVNPSFVRITGLSRAEATARLAEMVHATTPSSAVIQALWDTVHAGQIWQGRLSGQKRLGERYVADTTVTPVRNQAGEIDHFVATMRDVTREVQLEEQFRQAQKMEALGRLAGGIAHDFNNLLTVIHLSTQLLEQKLHPEDPLWELVQRIHETSERAGNLTKQLLSFSRRVVIEPQVLNLNELIDELSRMLQRLIGEDIELVISLSPDLWPVNVDRTQMDQVIVNLSVNARDAMPGGGKLIIETSNVVLDEAFVAAHVGAAPGKHVMLLIGDTGAGMSDEVKAHLFEPFFTTKGAGKGTGLGLPTVYGIVKQNQGYIEVHSEPGKGTTFRIYLPYARAGTAPKRAVTPSTTSGGTETILVVEDKAEVRNLTVQTLQSCGYQVLAAANGREALQVSGEYQGTIHLLLTDVVMPYMGGRELVERLHPQRPETRILYMSGYVDQQLTADVSEQSLAFLAKPFTQEKLTQQVRTVLDIPQP
jgi:PAS domain S-box-containing protein